MAGGRIGPRRLRLPVLGPRIHTLVLSFSLCNSTLPSLPSEYTVRILRILPERPINLASHPPTKGRRMPSYRAAKQPHTQRACRDHQSTDRCSVRESPRPRCSSLRLDPQASPVGASRLPLHPAQFAAHFRFKQLGNLSHHIPSSPSTAIYSSCSHAKMGCGGLFRN